MANNSHALPALCIDACDDVMTKIGKPRGLIDYITLEEADF